MLSILGNLYHEIVYRPLLNLLVFFYNLPPHDLGLVIILVTVLIRLVLAPSFHKSLKSQKAMNDLQPKLNEVREKYKDDKEGQAKAIMQLYKDNKINPLSSCLPVLVQLPLLIALYQVFSKALGNQISDLYSFVSKPEYISPKLLGILDLSRPNIYLGVLAGLLQFWQSKQMLAKTPASTDPTAKMMAVQTTYILPLVSVFIAVKLPAGLPLYWVVTTLFSIGQQYYIMRKHSEASV